MPIKEHQLEEFREIFNLYDEEGDGLIDGSQMGMVIRALGLGPTNEAIDKAAGKSYKKGEKRIPFEEVVPVYEALQKEKAVGTQADFVEALRVFDKDECGKCLGAELRHALMSLGERLTKDEVDDIMDGQEDPEGNINYESFIKKVMAGPFPDEN